MDKSLNKMGETIGLVICGILVAVFLICGWAFIFKDMNTGVETVKSENARLELIVNEINECIEAGDYARARMLTANLVFNASSVLPTRAVSEASDKWDARREELYALIDQAEGIYTGDSSTNSETGGNSENNVPHEDEFSSEDDSDVDFFDLVESGLNSFSNWLDGIGD